MNPATHTHFWSPRAPRTWCRLWRTNQAKTLPLFAGAAVVLACDVLHLERPWVARKA